jgi:hypothetical protein
MTRASSISSTWWTGRFRFAFQMGKQQMTDTPTSTPGKAKGNGAAPPANDPAQPSRLSLADIEAAMTDGDVIPDVGQTTILAAIAVGKPPKGAPFRAHPDPACAINTFVLVDREEGVVGETVYLVLPRARPFLANYIRPVKVALCFNGWTQRPFLWPITLPVGNAGRQSLWSKSALRIWEAAKTEWTCMVAGAGMYERHRPFVPVEGEPTWPDTPYNELLLMGFDACFIPDEHHEVARRKRTLRVLD